VNSFIASSIFTVFLSILTISVTGIMARGSIADDCETFGKFKVGHNLYSCVLIEEGEDSE